MAEVSPGLNIGPSTLAAIGRRAGLAGQLCCRHFQADPIGGLASGASGGLGYEHGGITRPGELGTYALAT